LIGRGTDKQDQVAYPRLNALIDRARSAAPILTGIVYPHDRTSLRAAVDSSVAGLIRPIFYGSARHIRALAAQENLTLCGEIEDTGELAARAAQAAASDASGGRIKALMKGSLHTDELLRPIVARDSGLRGQGRITHTFVFELPRYKKLLAVTDAVINITPDVRTKSDAILNSLQLLRILGIGSPKVAIVAAVETVNKNIPATLHAAELVEQARGGVFGSAIVEGPFGFDNAISSEAAAAKGIISGVAGDPDLLVVPDLNSGNLLYKSFVYMGGAECAGLVQGAAIPIILTSRADSHFSRIASCAIASIVSASAWPLPG
jgi:phosphotransacetylase